MVVEFISSKETTCRHSSSWRSGIVLGANGNLFQNIGINYSILKSFRKLRFRFLKYFELGHYFSVVLILDFTIFLTAKNKTKKQSS